MTISRETLKFVTVGPSLKSYWPLRLKDIYQMKSSPFGTEIAYTGFESFARGLRAEHYLLPYPVSNVYRVTIGTWRHNRGRMTRKGEAKTTATNLGVLNAKLRK